MPAAVVLLQSPRCCDGSQLHPAQEDALTPPPSWPLRILLRLCCCAVCFYPLRMLDKSVEPYPNSVGRGLEDDSYLQGTLPLHKAEGKMAQVMKVDTHTQRPRQRQA